MSTSAEQILIKLSEAGIQLSAPDSQLKFRAQSAAAVTDELRQLIRENKDALITYLTRDHTHVAIRPRMVKTPPPLSFIQQRLWFVDQTNPNSALYNISTAIRLTGTLNVPALEQSLAYLIARHASLRTTFDTPAPTARGSTGNGDPVQIIHDPTTFTLPVIPVSDVQHAEQLAQREATTGFDLREGPLFRAQLLKLPTAEHWLLLSLHHIISDGWSMDILLTELRQTYAAYVQGKEPTLVPLPIQYADFAQWQRDQLRSEKQKQQLAFWQKELTGAPAQLDLPTDRPRPPVPSHRGARHQFRITGPVVERLHHLAQQQRATLYMVLLTAYNILLARYSGQRDLVVGTGLANRSRTGTEGLIGFFVNLLPIRTQLEGNPSFTELLTRVRQMMLAVQDHQEVSFEQLVDALKVKRNPSYGPLAQVMFNLQSAAADIDAAIAWTPDLAATQYFPAVPFAKYDLTLSLLEGKATLEGSLEYSTDLFDATTIARMAAHFQVLLAEIVKDPGQPVLGIPLLTEPERQQLLVTWNATKTDYPKLKAIPQLFAEQVARTPNAIAAIYGAEQITYHELNHRANQLAHWLMAKGGGPNVLVGLSVERSINMLVGMVGILKAGGAYVPLDPTYPQERLAFMIADAQLTILLTEERFVDRLSGYAADLLALDSDWSSIASVPEENPSIRLSPEDLAYVIYTSGSTGQPKGVMVPHRAINRLVNNTNYITITAADRMAQASNASFDAATFEIWGALLHGAYLIGISHDVATVPAKLANVLQEQKVSILFLTTALFNQVVHDAPQAFQHLRYLLFGGEAVDPAAVRKLLVFGAPEHFLHVYGPTESTTYATWYPIQAVAETATTVPIGAALANSQTYVLNEMLAPVPVGVSGELYIGGDGIALGYLNRPELTAERFIVNPFGEGMLYKTGDIVRYRADGQIEFQGRADFQVKIRGFRIELGEIEAVLYQHPAVREAIVVARKVAAGELQLTAYVVEERKEDTVDHGSAQPLHPPALRAYLKERLPEYMIPAAFVLLDTLPLTPNGKIDRLALPDPDMRSQVQESYASAQNKLQQQLVEIWQEELGIEEVGIHDNFFDIGGHSILLIKVHRRFKELTDKPLDIVDHYHYPTIHELCAYLEPSAEEAPAEPVAQPTTAPTQAAQQPTDQQAIAIVGMAGRFPGADSIATLWQNLAAGVESVTFFSEEELRAAGVRPERLANPAYVKAGAILSDIEHFDADFFGFSSREATLLDPQIRLFLECAWTALEDAGCDPQTYSGQIGVFAGSGENSYELNHLRPAMQAATLTNAFQTLTTNGKDFLATHTAYRLNLRGPAVTMQTACSTSLVAVHMACQSLHQGDCDMALAGGVSAWTPVYSGYMSEEGMILSPDGHCRAFDQASAGTFAGSGVGIVALKRLQDAVDDGDLIYAVIKGSAINNDGSNKVGYTAPSVEGQSAVIRKALANADVAPETIAFVETHGTGTQLGDSIELTALKSVFAERLSQPTSTKILLGAVKTNFGHLNAAAGVTGLIKSALALKQQAIPPTLHFTKPNPTLNFPTDLFAINTELVPWLTQPTQAEAPASPRRAGVSSFGIGGTNAHVVLEEAPAQATLPNAIERTYHLLTLSAKTEQALRAMAAHYATWLAKIAAEGSNSDLANLCYTTHVGRSHFHHRLALVASSPQAMQAQLQAYGAGSATPAANQGDIHQGVIAKSRSTPQIAFLFTGQGSQYIGMGQELYATQPTFRATIDRCDEILQSCLGRSLLALIYPARTPEHNDLIESHPCGQATNFAIECALADLWRSWGIEPDFVLGHSLGDFAAAYTAGVLSLEDGLRLVTERGRLMETALGSMVSVLASEADVTPFLSAYEEVTIGVINGPESVVISGAEDQVAALTAQLDAAGFKTRKLAIPVAAHSPMLDPVLDAFEERVRGIALAQPKLPVVSSMTGQLVADEMTDPAYWRQHLRNTVRFADGLQTLRMHGCTIYLEIGPKPTLLGMVEQMQDDATAQTPIVTLPSLRETNSDWQQMLSSLAELYTLGVPVDWPGFDKDYQRRKVQLPAYPFQRQRYWVDAPNRTAHQAAEAGVSQSLRPLIDQMIHNPVANTTTFETSFYMERLSYLADYRIAQIAVAPAALQLALLLDAAELAVAGQGWALDGVAFPEPLVVPETGKRTVQLVTQLLDAGAQNNVDAERFDLQLVSFTPNQRKPQIFTHATGQLRTLLDAPAEAGCLASYRGRCPEAVDVATLYPADMGHNRINTITTGPTWRWLTHVWRGEGEAVGKLTAPRGLSDGDAYRLHPGLIESCLQLTGALGSQSVETLVPSALRTLNAYHNQAADTASPDEWWCTVRQTNAMGWDIQLFDQAGELLLAIEGLALQPTPFAAIYAQSDLWRQWLYTVAWQPLVINDPALPQPFSPVALPTHSPQRQWLLFADTQGAGKALATQLHHKGTLNGVNATTVGAKINGTNGTSSHSSNEVILVRPGDSYQQLDAHTFTIRPDYAADYRQLLTALPAVTNVVHCWSLDGSLPHAGTQQHDGHAVDTDALQQATHLACASALYLTQALLHEQTSPARLWLVTRGAQALHTEPFAQTHASHQDEVTGVAQSALWGLAKTIGLEHPEVDCVCVDLDDRAPAAAQMPLLATALQSADLRTKGEDQLLLRNGGYYVPRLTRYEAVPDKELPAKIAIRGDASYLITGGLGGLGLEIAAWLVEQGASHLILIGRSQPTPSAQAKVDKLLALGAQVRVVQADVSDRAQVAALLAKIPDAYPLRGVIHAAGVLSDGALLQQRWSEFEQVFAPKVWGTWHLHNLTQTMPLDFFVLFSSAAGLLGNRGQANHAAANAFMDALAHHRHAQGLPALSINWAGWTGVGTAAKLSNQNIAEVHLATRGFGGYTPQQGVQAFAQLFNQHHAQMACMKINWREYLNDHTHTIPFYSRLAQEVEAVPKTKTKPMSPAGTPALYEQLRRLAPQEQTVLLTQTLQAEVGRQLGITPEQVDIQLGIIQLGMDSLMAIALRNRLQTMLQIKIPVAKFLEDVELTRMVHELLEEFNNSSTPAAVNQEDDLDQVAADFVLDTTAAAQGKTVKVKEILI